LRVKSIAVPAEYPIGRLLVLLMVLAGVACSPAALGRPRWSEHRHHIRTLFVLFDSVWDPSPRLGQQHAPVPGAPATSNVPKAFR
jgi:hypothetical protein